MSFSRSDCFPWYLETGNATGQFSNRGLPGVVSEKNILLFDESQPAVGFLASDVSIEGHRGCVSIDDFSSPSGMLLVGCASRRALLGTHPILYFGVLRPVYP